MAVEKVRKRSLATSEHLRSKSYFKILKVIEYGRRKNIKFCKRLRTFKDNTTSQKTLQHKKESV